jgi:hypothetical protein
MEASVMELMQQSNAVHAHRQASKPTTQDGYGDYQYHAAAQQRGGQFL